MSLTNKERINMIESNRNFSQEQYNKGHITKELLNILNKDGDSRIKELKAEIRNGIK